MKKILASILLILYVSISSGVVINLHYCMNKLDSAKLGMAKSDSCNRCGMPTEEANGCCHDELKIIKIQDAQKVSQLNYDSHTLQVDLIPQSELFEQYVISADQVIFSENHSPPLSKQDTYLLNCVFRI